MLGNQPEQYFFKITSYGNSSLITWFSSFYQLFHLRFFRTFFLPLANAVSTFVKVESILASSISHHIGVGLWFLFQQVLWGGCLPELWLKF